MKHRLTGLALQWWALKRNGKRDSLAARGVWLDFRHAVHQGSRDYKRRGLSNREGANNRRFRSWKATQDYSGTILWPDYAL